MLYIFRLILDNVYYLRCYSTTIFFFYLKSFFKFYVDDSRLLYLVECNIFITILFLLDESCLLYLVDFNIFFFVNKQIFYLFKLLDLYSLRSHEFGLYSSKSSHVLGVWSNLMKTKEY